MTNKGSSKLSDILNESVLTNSGFGQALDKCMLFNFWKSIAGRRFEKMSIPYDLKGTLLFVTVQSPAVIQDLSLFKNDIIEKYKPYAEGLGFKITDIKFDYKNWRSVKYTLNNETASGIFDSDMPDYYTDKDYETIGLDNNEEKEFKNLRESIEKINFLPPELKEKMYNNALNQYKAQKLRMSLKNAGKN